MTPAMMTRSMGTILYTLGSLRPIGVVGPPQPVVGSAKEAPKAKAKHKGPRACRNGGKASVMTPKSFHMRLPSHGGRAARLGGQHGSM